MKIETIHRLTGVVLALTIAVTACGFYYAKQTITNEVDQLRAEIVTIKSQNASLENQITNLESIIVESIDITNEQVATLQSNVDSRIVDIANDTADQIAKQANSTQSIIERWNDAIYRITCEVTTDTQDVVSNGSAIVYLENNQQMAISTEHIFEEDGYIAHECILVRSDSEADAKIDPNNFDLDADRDLAYGIVHNSLPNLRPLSYCDEQPAIGDSIVILGYPRIGAFSSITATEGIIAGFDENEYLTTAKIDAGSSGGAAISVSSNCLLGIPTTVRKGQLESLARILPLGL